MPQRIKYVKVTEMIFKTEGRIKTFAHGEVDVSFNLEDNSFKITTSSGSIVLAEGKATSPHKVKIKIRQALTKLGIPHSKEVRQPRK